MEEESSFSWSYLVIGVAIFAFAWWLHGVFGRLEATGGSLRIHWIAALLYKALGKWGVTGFLSLIGAGIVWKAFHGGDEEA